MVKNKQGIEGARRLLLAQLLVILLLAAIAAFISGLQAGASAVLGGLVSAIPTAIFARMAFRYNGVFAAKHILSSFYKGEALKMLLTFGLFVLIFKTLKIVPFTLIVGYIVAQMVFWFAPLIFSNKRK